MVGGGAEGSGEEHPSGAVCGDDDDVFVVVLIAGDADPSWLEGPSQLEPGAEKGEAAPLPKTD
jgi:hypothetical protein